MRNLVVERILNSYMWSDNGDVAKASVNGHDGLRQLFATMSDESLLELYDECTSNYAEILRSDP